jgi:hypothetical protein
MKPPDTTIIPTGQSVIEYRNFPSMSSIFIRVRKISCLEKGVMLFGFNNTIIKWKNLDLTHFPASSILISNRTSKRQVTVGEFVGICEPWKERF